MSRTPDTISTLRDVLGRCRTIAVVGLSPQWHRPSFFAAKYMQAHGYRIVPVNPLVAQSGGSILGEICFASLSEAGQAIARQGRAHRHGGLLSQKRRHPAAGRRCHRHWRQLPVAAARRGQ
jgi:hypothetical protein